jgi:dimethylaniline monooxygenase (N-oxide forming)
VKRIRLETTVTQVERTPSGGWILTLNNGPAIECAKLIWGVGPGSSPVMPTWPRDNFTNPVIHSCETGSNLKEIAEAKHVTVIGGAKSSFDAVYSLLKSDKKVDWIIREEGGGPIAIGPPSLFGIWNTVDGLSTRAMASFSPSIMNTSGPIYQAIHRTWIGRTVAKTFWRIANVLADTAAGYSSNEQLKKIRPTPYGYG